MKRTYLNALLAVLCLFIFGTLQAQISDRVNSPTTFKTGTRPVMGNMGITFGTSYQEIDKILDSNTDYEALPIFSLKYYTTNDLVFTLGIKSSKEKVSLSGELTGDFLANGGIIERKIKSVESDIQLVPGIEKHFVQSNILDVYLGARVPLGLRRELLVNNTSENDGDFVEFKTSKNRIAYGIDFFSGLQAFIADLPFAIGMEFEISGFGYRGDKTKVSYADNTGANNVYYTTDNADILAIDGTIGGLAFDKLTASTFTIETDLRVTLSYYFRR